MTHYRSSKFPLLDLDGRPYAVCGLSTDITARKLAEEKLVRVNRELRDSEERFRQIAELVPDMLWSAELDGRVRFISRRFQHYIGVGEPEFGSGGWERVVHPEDADNLAKLFAAKNGLGGPLEKEMRLRQADGGYRWFMSRTAAVFDDAGAAIYWLGSFSDIDEFKRNEQALRRSNEELEQFAYAAAHDLQEPLRNVSLSLGMLRMQSGSRVTAEEGKWVEESIKNAQRMQAMVQDLLQYSRSISQDEQALVPESARAAAEQALQNLSEVMRESQAQVEVGELPEIAMRKHHLVMLFQNLVGNSIKYRKAGVAPQIRISAAKTGENWQFTVRDNGIGFDPVYADRIFKVFKRLHTRDEYAGNGIGLSVCARIVAHYGGRICAEAQPGQGAIFALLFRDTT